MKSLKLAAALVLGLGTAAGSAIELETPLACPAEGCIVQNFYDHDAGSGARDYACGTLVYDGHNGTDFRVATLQDMENGVAVLAAAAGRVLRTRDGVPDQRYDPAEPGATKGRECGNAVIVAHADGFETQYCHLKQGTVRVRPGDPVEAGRPLGQIGMSGFAQFPHVHLTVRKGERAIDPFRPDGDAGSCATDLGASLWSPGARERLPYRPAVILDGGFSAEPLEKAAVEAGAVPSFGADASRMVGWARVIGLRAGDIMSVALRDPAGAVLAEVRSPPFEGPRAQHILSAGKRRPASGWPPGRYVLQVVVERAGTPVGERSFMLAIEG